MPTTGPTSNYFERGVALFETKEYDKAIADFDLVIERNPQNVEALTKRGLAWDSKKEPDKAFDKAIADYTEAIPGLGGVECG